MVPLVLFVVALFLSAACGGSGAASSRQVARSGQVVLGSEMQDFNFSMELPERWRLEEHFSWNDERPAGGNIVVSEEGNPEHNEVFVQWSATNQWDSGILAMMRQRSDVVVEELQIEGVRVNVVYPDPELPVDSVMNWVGVAYESLPGASPGVAGVPLTFQSSSYPNETLPQIIEVLKTVRYAELDSPPAPPVVASSPGDDWVALAPQMFDGWATGRSPRFNVLVPPGAEGTVGAGYDSIIYSIQIGDALIHGERGQADQIVSSPGPAPGTTIWEKEVAGAAGHFWTKGNDDGTFDLGVFYPLIPEYPRRVAGSGATAAVLSVESVPAQARPEILAVLESVRYAE